MCPDLTVTSVEYLINNRILADELSERQKLLQSEGMKTSSYKNKAERCIKRLSSVSCPSLVGLVSSTSKCAANTDNSTCQNDACREKSKARTPVPRMQTPSDRLSLLYTPCRRCMALPSLESNRKLPLLVVITPENEKSERDRFMRANFNYNPFFVYRFAADDRMMERFNAPSDKYLDIAIMIMENVIKKFGNYEKFEDRTGGRVLSRSEIFGLTQRYLKREKLQAEIKVNLSEDLLSRGSMTLKKGQPQLNVRVLNTREFWCEGLLRHEVGTHYLRTCNNRCQMWAIPAQRQELRLQHYNPTEEGLASLHSVLSRPHPYLWRAALLYYVTQRAAHLSFKDLFVDLGQFVQSPSTRWDYCVRAKRGQTDTCVPGTFCKDQVYLEGALQLLKHRHTLDFHMLMRLGKVAHEDVKRLAELCILDGTRIPSFMANLDEYKQKLDYIAECNGLTDHILRDVD